MTRNIWNPDWDCFRTFPGITGFQTSSDKEERGPGVAVLSLREALRCVFEQDTMLSA